MFIGNYAKSVDKCNICSGKGCFKCERKGFVERKHLLISEQQLNQYHIQIQQNLKTIQGEIIDE